MIHLTFSKFSDIYPSSLGGSFGCAFRRLGGRGFNPCPGPQHSFMENDHEIFSTVILSLPLIQDGQLSVSGEPASVAQLDAPSDWRPGGRGFNPRRSQQHSFVEIDHEIFSTVILSLPLIQEGQLSVSGERMCTIPVNHLEDKACPVTCG